LRLGRDTTTVVAPNRHSIYPITSVGSPQPT